MSSGKLLLPTEDVNVLNHTRRCAPDSSSGSGGQADLQGFNSCAAGMHLHGPEFPGMLLGLQAHVQKLQLKQLCVCESDSSHPTPSGQTWEQPYISTPQTPAAAAAAASTIIDGVRAVALCGCLTNQCLQQASSATNAQTTMIVNDMCSAQTVRGWYSGGTTYGCVWVPAKWCIVEML